MGKRLTSTPISARITRAVPTSIPSINVRSTPNAWNNGPFASNRTSLLLAPTLARVDGPSLLSRPVRELRQFCLNLLVALGDLLMMELVQLVRLPKLEEMFGPPRSFQREGNLVLAVMTAPIPQFGQFDGIAFALQDGLDDRHAGQPRDVADDFRSV